MKKFVIGLSALVAMVALAADDSFGQQPGAAAPQPASPSAPARPRIALVNIAKVLREFNKAAADGQVVNKKRQEYMDKAKPLGERLAKLSRDIQQTVNVTEKEKLQKEAVALNRQLEDINQEAERVLTELRDHTIVEVYQNIKQVINDIAVTNNLDLVMCYPDSSTPEEEKKAVVAQMKLQSPGLIPFYHRGMDITEVVILTLNKRHPAPPVNTSATPPPSGQIQPTGAKQ